MKKLGLIFLLLSLVHESALAFPRAALLRIETIRHLHLSGEVAQTDPPFWKPRSPIEIEMNAALDNIERFCSYLGDLAQEAFARQLRSNDPDLVQLTNLGELDRSTVLSVLLDRLKRRGLSISLVSHIESPENFLEKIKKGATIDLGVYLEGHGAFSHLVQLDYIFGVAEKLGGPMAPRAFLDGLTLESWAACCDNNAIRRNLHTAAWIEHQFLFWLNLESSSGERRSLSLHLSPEGLFGPENLRTTKEVQMLNDELSRLESLLKKYPAEKFPADSLHKAEMSFRDHRFSKVDIQRRHQKYLQLLRQNPSQGLASALCLQSIANE